MPLIIHEGDHRLTRWQCEICTASVASHKWAMIRAWHEGWYFTKDGLSFCFEHRPAWAKPL
jgi:hypothetical protein